MRDGTLFRLLGKDLNELYAFDTGETFRRAIPVDLDLDGDGRIEVVVATESGVHLLGRP